MTFNLNPEPNYLQFTGEREAGQKWLLKCPGSVTGRPRSRPPPPLGAAKAVRGGRPRPQRAACEDSTIGRRPLHMGAAVQRGGLSSSNKSQVPKIRHRLPPESSPLGGSSECCKGTVGKSAGAGFHSQPPRPLSPLPGVAEATGASQGRAPVARAPLPPAASLRGKDKLPPPEQARQGRAPRSIPPPALPEVPGTPRRDPPPAPPSSLCLNSKRKSKSNSCSAPTPVMAPAARRDPRHVPAPRRRRSSRPAPSSPPLCAGTPAAAEPGRAPPPCGLRASPGKAQDGGRCER